MKKLLKELLQQLEFESKDYRTESFPSIQDAIKHELAKPEQEPNIQLVPIRTEQIDGITLEYDFLGGVNIKPADDFVYVRVNYDHRYTYNSAREKLARDIVKLLIRKNDDAEPLYTAPPKREPLNHGEIADILNVTVDYIELGGASKLVDFIREVEMAHGIGVENE